MIEEVRLMVKMPVEACNHCALVGMWEGDVGHSVG